MAQPNHLVQTAHLISGAPLSQRHVSGIPLIVFEGLKVCLCLLHIMSHHHTTMVAVAPLLACRQGTLSRRTQCCVPLMEIEPNRDERRVCAGCLAPVLWPGGSQRQRDTARHGVPGGGQAEPPAGAVGHPGRQGAHLYTAPRALPPPQTVVCTPIQRYFCTPQLLVYLENAADLCFIPAMASL